MVLGTICGHSLDNRDNSLGYWSNSLGYWSNRDLDLLDSWSRSSYRNLNLLDNGGGLRNWLNHRLSNHWCGTAGKENIEKAKLNFTDPMAA